MGSDAALIPTAVTVMGSFKLSSAIIPPLLSGQTVLPALWLLP